MHLDLSGQRSEVLRVVRLHGDHPWAGGEMLAFRNIGAAGRAVENRGLRSVLAIHQSFNGTVHLKKILFCSH